MIAEVAYFMAIYRIVITAYLIRVKKRICGSDLVMWLLYVSNFSFNDKRSRKSVFFFGRAVSNYVVFAFGIIFVAHIIHFFKIYYEK